MHIIYSSAEQHECVRSLFSVELLIFLMLSTRRNSKRRWTHASLHNISNCIRLYIWRKHLPVKWPAHTHIHTQTHLKIFVRKQTQFLFCDCFLALNSFLSVLFHCCLVSCIRECIIYIYFNVLHPNVVVTVQCTIIQWEKCELGIAMWNGERKPRKQQHMCNIFRLFASSRSCIKVRIVTQPYTSLCNEYRAGVLVSCHVNNVWVESSRVELKSNGNDVRKVKWEPNDKKEPRANKRTKPFAFGGTFL